MVSYFSTSLLVVCRYAQCIPNTNNSSLVHVIMNRANIYRVRHSIVVCLNTVRKRELLNHTASVLNENKGGKNLNLVPSAQTLRTQKRRPSNTLGYKEKLAGALLDTW